MTQLTIGTPKKFNSKEGPKYDVVQRNAIKLERGKKRKAKRKFTNVSKRINRMKK